jgi:hypothetical protein
VGCAFEVVTVAKEYWKDKGDWHEARLRGQISFPEKPPIKWLLFDMLGVILVIAGIGGELHVNVQAGRVETRLREANSQLVLLLGGKAKSAELSAKNAAADALTANSAADTAGIKAEAVGKKADIVKASVEATDKKAAVLEFEIGAAQDILSDREKFNPERLKKQLSAFRGKTILFRSYLNDGDGYFLCERLLSDATDSSVGIIGIDQCGGFTAKLPFTTGVGIYASDWETVSALSKILMASVAPSIVTGSIAPATIIIVGRKPWGRVGPFRRTIPVPPPPDTSNTNAKP